MQRIVVIINGAGGVGKDTICNIVGQHYKVKMISSIDPIKRIASFGGWTYKDKSVAGRRMLSELKRIFVEYNDLPNQYLIKEYNKFISGNKDILFVQIREPEEIEKFRNEVSIRCISLLIKTKRIAVEYGNSSDDGVYNYSYDYIYNNDKSISELDEDFMRFFQIVLKR